MLISSRNLSRIERVVFYCPKHLFFYGDFLLVDVDSRGVVFHWYKYLFHSVGSIGGFLENIVYTTFLQLSYILHRFLLVL